MIKNSKIMIREIKNFKICNWSRLYRGENRIQTTVLHTTWAYIANDAKEIKRKISIKIACKFQALTFFFLPTQASKSSSLQADGRNMHTVRWRKSYILVDHSKYICSSCLINLISLNAGRLCIGVPTFEQWECNPFHQAKIPSILQLVSDWTLFLCCRLRSTKYSLQFQSDTGL